MCLSDVKGLKKNTSTSGALIHRRLTLHSSSVYSGTESVLYHHVQEV